MPVTHRLPLLTAIALACTVSLSAQANPNAPDYNQVVLYGNVTIAQDSTSSWGVWEEIEPPAAGPNTPLPTIPGSSDLYRPLAQLNTPTSTSTLGCASGSLCGYGASTSYLRYIGDSFYEVELEEEGPFIEIAPVSRGVVMIPTVDTPATAPAWLPQVFAPNFGLLRDEGGAPSVTLTEPLTQLPDQFGFGKLYRSSGADYDAELWTYEVESNVPDNGLKLAMFHSSITRYVNGREAAERDGTATQTEISGVWGVTTAAQDMDALRQGQVTATYNGQALFASNAPVTMSVNFGNSTFEARFNGGRDGANVMVATTANGGKQLFGDVGLIVGGTISGSNLEGRTFTAQDGTISNAKMAASFYGTNAAVAAGTIDFVKTRVATSGTPVPGAPGAPGAPIGPAIGVATPSAVIVRPVEPTAPSLGYTDARHVTTFVAGREGVKIDIGK